ncbi:hypothetical protein [Saccharothrix stipae]
MSTHDDPDRTPPQGFRAPDYRAVQPAPEPGPDPSDFRVPAGSQTGQFVHPQAATPPQAGEQVPPGRGSGGSFTATPPAGQFLHPQAVEPSVAGTGFARLSGPRADADDVEPRHVVDTGAGQFTHSRAVEPGTADAGYVPSSRPRADAGDGERRYLLDADEEAGLWSAAPPVIGEADSLPSPITRPPAPSPPPAPQPQPAPQHEPRKRSFWSKVTGRES